MLDKIVPLILLCLCLGCTSEQWVKEYVKGETLGLQEALDGHIADIDKKQEELIKRQTVLEEQIREMRTSLEAMDKKLTEWYAFIEWLKEAGKPGEGPQIAEGASAKTTDILNLKSEMENKFARLEEMERALNRLKESEQMTSTMSDKALDSLAAQINDAKRFVDMNITEVLKAQNRLKEFIIEEVRLLKVEHQGYAKELEAIKSRLQTLENATGEKKPPEV